MTDHCDGRHALGSCAHRAKYRLTAHNRLGGQRLQYACGVHLAQIVKAMLMPERPVTVEEWS